VKVWQEFLATSENLKKQKTQPEETTHHAMVRRPLIAAFGFLSSYKEQHNQNKQPIVGWSGVF
jgi:hypothetical protein